jgi:hypothetical protein
MTTQKATHRGNCQVCAHQHHVMGAVLAKHGYTVKFGFFNGTCRGSGQKPMQIERALTDSTVVALGVYAANQDEHVVGLMTGTKHPREVQTGTKFNRDTYKYEPVYIAWAQGTDEQKAKAVDIAVAQGQSESRHARAHARSLERMANELHGTALVAIIDHVKIEKPKAVVDLKAGKVDGTFGSKAARKLELDRINRIYSKEIDKLQAIYRAMPNDVRTDAQAEVYYSPMYPHQWKPRHSAAALKEFPQAAEIVAVIEELVRAREAVKVAP